MRSLYTTEKLTNAAKKIETLQIDRQNIGNQQNKIDNKHLEEKNI